MPKHPAATGNKPHRLDVIEIVKNKDGSFVVRGGINNNVIQVPAQVANKERLEERLNGIAQITPAESSNSAPYQKIIGICMTIVFIVFMLSKDQTVIGVAGPLLAVWYTYALIRGQRNKYIDAKLKKKMWVSLIIILIIVARTVAAFAGYI